MNILIAGISGVIGLELSKILIKNGHNVIGIDRKEKPSSFADILYLQKDINFLNPYEIENLDFEIAINLAASFERTEESIDFFKVNFQDNLSASNNFLNLVIKKNINQYIFASSYLVYDQEQYLSNKSSNSTFKLSENSILFPRNLIGSSKMMHELETKAIERHYPRTKFVNLRIFRGIGLGSNCVVSRWIRNALNEKPIDLYNKEGSFDYIYSKDSALGISEAINHQLSGTYNLGSGKSRYVKDVIDHLSLRFPNIKINDLGTKGKIENSSADITTFASVTNYKPMYSLEDSIDEMIAFESDLLIQSNETSTKNILITSSSNKTALVESAEHWKKYNTSKIYYGDSKENVMTNFLFNNFIHLPRTEKNNINKITSILKNLQISSILPTRDGELDFWAKYKKIFLDENIEIIISDLNCIEICQDKFKFYLFCKENSIPCINTYLTPCSPPLISKPRFGSGSSNFKKYLSSENPESFKKENYVFQPFIKGREYSFDALSDMNGKFICGIIRERKLVINGESKITTQLREDSWETNCINLLNKLKIKGPSITQFFVTDDKEQLFIEVNARVGGGYTSIVYSGLRFWDFIKNPKDFDFKRPWSYGEPLLGTLKRSEKDEFITNL